MICCMMRFTQNCGMLHYFQSKWLVADYKIRKKKETRTRRDRIQLRINGFLTQMEGIVLAYMDWSFTTRDLRLDSILPVPDPSLVDGHLTVHVLDVFCE